MPPSAWQDTQFFARIGAISLEYAIFENSACRSRYGKLSAGLSICTVETATDLPAIRLSRALAT